MLNKYLRIAGYVILYHIILVGFNLLAPFLWIKFTPRDFTFPNFIIANCLGFLVIILAYGLVFKLRKKSLIQTMNFGKLDFKNFLIVLTAGILMGVFTSCLCNINVVQKNIPTFEQYLSILIDYTANFWRFLVVVAITFALEEMIFRGTIFNEIRTGVALYPAIFISVALYGLLNGFSMGWIIGIYATVASLFYTLGYVYQRSLWASITFQVSSIYVIAIFRKAGIWKWLGGLNGGVLIAAVIGAVVIILILFYKMYKDFQKFNAATNASLSA